MNRILSVLFILVSQLNGQTFGWKSNPRHHKGLTQVSYALRAAPVPPAASVKGNLFYFTDQDSLGACVAFTAVEAYDYQYKRQHGRFAKPSFLDCYQQLLRKDGSWPIDNGSYTSTALFVLRNSGVCKESKWPYIPANLGVNPPDKATKDRKNHTATLAYDVPNNDGGYAIRACISQLKIPVLTGGYWASNWMEPLKAQDGRYYIPLPSRSNVGGHEVLIVSYDDNLVINGVKGWVEFKNHWRGSNGHPWADAIGCCWAPQSAFFNPRRFEDNGAIEITR